MQSYSKFYDVEQNSEEWMQLRLGKFTASSFKQLFAAKSTLDYRKCINQVVYEILTGEHPESFSNQYMERGHELEPIAKEIYSLKTFNDIDNGGFFELNKYTGCSPDGLVGENGLIEIKCPSFNTMIEYLENKTLPNEYKYQVHGQLFVTGRKYCDFMAFHPKLKPLIIRIARDETICTQIDLALKEAIKTVENKVKNLV